MPPKKLAEGSGLFHKDHHKEVWYLLVALALLGALVERLIYFFSHAWSGLFAAILAWLLRFWPTWKILVIIFAFFGVIWAIYAAIKRREIERAEEKIFGPLIHDSFLEPDVPQKKEENQKWLKVMEHTHSNNPADWRLAIIEADVMLEDLLKTLGYRGDGIGDMLKSVDSTDMLTLDNAWEAHKVRNRIAHAGSDFELNERETKRVITLFESVFREFQYI